MEYWLVLRIGRLERALGVYGTWAQAEDARRDALDRMADGPPRVEITALEPPRDDAPRTREAIE